MQIKHGKPQKLLEYNNNGSKVYYNVHLKTNNKKIFLKVGDPEGYEINWSDVGYPGEQKLYTIVDNS